MRVEETAPRPTVRTPSRPAAGWADGAGGVVTRLRVTSHDISTDVSHCHDKVAGLGVCLCSQPVSGTLFRDVCPSTPARSTHRLAHPASPAACATTSQTGGRFVFPPDSYAPSSAKSRPQVSPNRRQQ